jgi:hypothetical protein
MKPIFQVLIIISSITIFSCTTLTITEKKSAKEFYNTPVKTTDNFIWGINGHPVTTLDYAVGNLKQEFKLLKEHQFDMYRIDIRTDSSGNVVWYPERFEELLSESVKEKVDILPIIIIDQLINEYTLSPEEAYMLGKKQTKGFVRKYGKYFDYYELGNEQERKIILPNVNGSLMSDYNQRKFKIVSSYLKGMMEAIKINDPSAKLLISASWLHWGYFDLLESAGINFDIISYHWYSNMGSMFNSRHENVNIINTLTKRYNKPIWITEINKKDGSIYGTEEEQAYWVDYFIHELDYQSNIKALFIYELYDESNLKNQDWISEGEAYYGIVKWKTTPKQNNAIQHKPVSDVLKFRIEEIKYGREDYVFSLLKYINQQRKSGQEIKINSDKLLKLNSKELIIDKILVELNDLNLQKTSNFNVEFAEGNIIDNTYNALLKRNPTENERKYWIRKLKRKNTNIIKTILLSEEYWENAIWSGYERRTGFKRP